MVMVGKDQKPTGTDGDQQQCMVVQPVRIDGTRSACPPSGSERFPWYVPMILCPSQLTREPVQWLRGVDLEFLFEDDAVGTGGKWLQNIRKFVF